eukprot:143071-Chlamydomonas_euryale.AAC.1
MGNALGCCRGGAVAPEDGGAAVLHAEHDDVDSRGLSGAAADARVSVADPKQHPALKRNQVAPEPGVADARATPKTGLHLFGGAPAGPPSPVKPKPAPAAPAAATGPASWSLFVEELSALASQASARTLHPAKLASKMQAQMRKLPAWMISLEALPGNESARARAAAAAAAAAVAEASLRDVVAAAERTLTHGRASSSSGGGGGRAVWDTLDVPRVLAALHSAAETEHPGLHLVD